MSNDKSNTASQHPGLQFASVLSQIAALSDTPSTFLIPGSGSGAGLGGLLNLLKGFSESAPAPVPLPVQDDQAPALPAPGGQAVAEQPVAPVGGEIWTVTSTDARRRDPDRNFESFGKEQNIPCWTQVYILETRTMNDGKPVVRMQDTQGAILGWTAKSNLARFMKDQKELRQCALAQGADKQLAPSSRSKIEKGMAAVWSRTGALLEKLAGEAGIERALALAIWYKESAGGDHTPDSMIIRFEAHKFRSNWSGSTDSGKPYSAATFDDHFRYCGSGVSVGDTVCAEECGKDKSGDPKPWLSQQVRFPAADGAPENSRAWTCVSPDSQTDRYRVLALARQLAGDEPAMKSISMGGPQIMGSNHATLGYQNARAMYDAFQADERWHVLGLFDYLLHYNSELREAATATPPDCKQIGTIYNGAASYGTDLQSKYNTATALLAAMDEKTKTG